MYPEDQTNTARSILELQQFSDITDYCLYNNHLYINRKESLDYKMMSIFKAWGPMYAPIEDEE